MSDDLHFEDCSDYTQGFHTWRGAKGGDLMQRCRNCERISVREPAVTPVKTTPPLVAQRSSYVCPVHGEPVRAISGRSRGCGACSADRQRWRDQRRGKQTKRREHRASIERIEATL